MDKKISLIKSILDKATFHNENGLHYFSNKLSDLVEFENNHGIDFHKLLDSLDDEEKSIILTPYYK